MDDIEGLQQEVGQVYNLSLYGLSAGVIQLPSLIINHPKLGQVGHISETRFFPSLNRSS